MSERHKVPDSDALFLALSGATLAGSAPEACMSAAARALCLMALSWRLSNTSQADARLYVHQLVERSLHELRRSTRELRPAFRSGRAWLAPRW